jgi:transposase InsO family protein
MEQWLRRCAERDVRKRAVAFARWGRRNHRSCRQAAAQLGLSSITLRRWGRHWRHDRLTPHRQGRPRRHTDPLLPLSVRQHLDVLGPMAGLPVLRASFPQATRSQLQYIQQHYRREWRRDHALVSEELEWLVAGSVWAADFTDPPMPIDGCFEHLLASRDLASRMQLEALPAPHANAALAVDTLESLFRCHGPPLVLKTDNGSPFIAQVFVQLLDRWKVTLLLSPPCTPRYNGSVEAGMGSLKTGIFYQAAHNGRSGSWTSDDVDAARELANHTLRPWGVGGPTPLERWQDRPAITLAQRDDFRRCVLESEQIILDEEGLCDEPIEVISHTARASVVRAAIRRALETLGYLRARKKWISPPFNSPLRNNIR